MAVQGGDLIAMDVCYNRSCCHNATCDNMLSCRGEGPKSLAGHQEAFDKLCDAIERLVVKKGKILQMAKHCKFYDELARRGGVLRSVK